MNLLALLLTLFTLESVASTENSTTTATTITSMTASEYDGLIPENSPVTPSSCTTINDPACTFPFKSRCNVLRKQCACPLGFHLKSNSCVPIQCTSDHICNLLNPDYHLVCSNSSHPNFYILDAHGRSNITKMGVCICNPAYFYPSADGFACQLRQSLVAAITFAALATFGLATALILYLHGPVCTEEDDC